MIDPVLEAKVREQAQALFDAVPVKREVPGEKFAMDEAPQAIVLREVDIQLGDGERLRIAVSDPAARPPFEWLMEITSEIGESDYIKHYLVRDHDIVLAQRKVLTPIDDHEAQIILADLATARRAL